MSGDTKVNFKKVAKHTGITVGLGGGTIGLGLLARWIWLLSAVSAQVEANEEAIRDEIKPQVAILRDAMVEQRVHNERTRDDLEWIREKLSE